MMIGAESACFSALAFELNFVARVEITVGKTQRGCELLFQSERKGEGRP